MSCIVLTDRPRRLVTALTEGPRKVEDLDVDNRVVDLLRRWGWAFGTDIIEPTGAGRYHAGTVDGGLVRSEMPARIRNASHARSTTRPDERSAGPTPAWPDRHSGRIR